MKKKEGKNCLICAGKTKEFTKSKNYIIYKCDKCGFGYTDNLVAQKGDYHRDDSYIEENKLFKNIFQKRVNQITKYLTKGKVLEIGCSTGLMLNIFKDKGFEVKGIELSKKAADAARDRGLEIIVKPFEKVDLKEKFDLIIFNHTLEHMEQPLLILEKCKKLLTPKGYLMIDLPNFDSPMAKILRKRWSHLLPDEHLWHFTENSYKHLFKKLDFKIIKVVKSSGIWNLANPYYELLLSLKSMKKRFFSNIATLIPAFIMSKLNKGSDLLIIVRKK